MDGEMQEVLGNDPGTVFPSNSRVSVYEMPVQ